MKLQIRTRKPGHRPRCRTLFTSFSVLLKAAFLVAALTGATTFRSAHGEEMKDLVGEDDKRRQTVGSGVKDFMTSVEGTTEGADDFVLGTGELEEYLTELGSESFDNAEEIRRGVKEALENTDANGDGRISKKELKRYWKRLSKTLSTVDECVSKVFAAESVS